MRAALRAAACYALPPLKVNVVFFASDEVAGSHTVHYWRSLLVEHLRLIRIGGSHFTIIRKPNVDILAQEMAGCLSS